MEYFFLCVQLKKTIAFFFYEFSGLCGQFVEKVGRKDPLNFCLKEDIFVSHNMLKLERSMEYFLFYMTFCCQKHGI